MFALYTFLEVGSNGDERGCERRCNAVAGGFEAHGVCEGEVGLVGGDEMVWHGVEARVREKAGYRQGTPQSHFTVPE